MVFKYYHGNLNKLLYLLIWFGVFLLEKGIGGNGKEIKTS